MSRRPRLRFVGEAVKREGAERYLRVTLLSFAASVILTRLFLGLTGYPQLTTRTLHLAHVLWGGLLLFIATLVPLVLANRWAFSLSALLSGVGVGLFIDEVGKFITRSNDYFSPLAAPIIYALFLLTVLLYLRVRRPPSHDPRAELYRALDGLQEVLDHDLDRREWAELRSGLHRVARQSADPDLARLATALLDYLASASVRVVPALPGPLERWQGQLLRLEYRWLSRRRLKALLVFGLTALGLPAVLALVELVGVTTAPADLRGQIVAALIASRQITTATAAWLYLRLGLIVLGGLPPLLAAILLLLGREWWGIAVAYFGLLFTLSVVSLLTFYFDQFEAVLGALLQAIVLFGVIRYRRRYLG